MPHGLMALPAMAPAGVPKTLDVYAIADLLGCSKATVFRMVRDGRFPVPAVRTGGMTRWTTDQYLEWYHSRRPEA